jgi:hypothetical protein
MGKHAMQRRITKRLPFPQKSHHVACETTAASFPLLSKEGLGEVSSWPESTPLDPPFKRGEKDRTAFLEMGLRALLLAGILTGLGCVRSSPPEIPPYRPPAARVIKETPFLEIGEITEAVAYTPKPELKPAAKPKPEPEAPKPTVKEETKPQPAANTPTLVGTWTAQEMTTQNGVDLSSQMSITFTFGDDGQFSMTMSREGMPQPATQTGTYELSGDQITISVQGQTRTGTCTFDGPNRVTLALNDVRLVLARS